MAYSDKNPGKLLNDRFNNSITGRILSLNPRLHAIHIRKYMLKAASLALTAALTLSLAGCAQSSEKGTADGPEKYSVSADISNEYSAAETSVSGETDQSAEISASDSAGAGSEKADSGSPEAKGSDSERFDDLDKDTIVKKMGAGWNLGNQLEASLNKTPSETVWGNPVITPDLIKLVRSQGFKTIRVPVSYLSYIGSRKKGYRIKKAWLDRIEEVVDMCLDSGAFVIINMHGDGYNNVDGGWLLCNKKGQKEIRRKYRAVWRQIAKRFKNRDEHLIFESMNEEFDGQYSTPNRKYYRNLNAYNQIFTDTVRHTGGNNKKRWLLVPGWNTNIEYTTGNYGFKLPRDRFLSKKIKGKRLMISVHYYDPWDFAGEGTNASINQWGKNVTKPSAAASYGDQNAMDEALQKLKHFTDKGLPVIIGEYGSANKNNDRFRADYAGTLCRLAYNYGLVPVIWDNGVDKDGYALFDRKSLSVIHPAIIKAIRNVYG